MPALLAMFSVDRVEAWVAAGGVLIIFLLLFACGLGLPLPEDIPLLLGGYFASQGQMNLWAVGILSWCGIIGGDCVLYSLGRRYGLEITRVPFVGKHVTRERILKVERLFERYGIWVVAVGRLFAGIRGAMVVAAGATRFNFVKFVVADGLAALVSGGLFVALGYYLGKKLGSFQDIQKAIEPYKHWVALGVVAAAVLLALYFWWQHRRRETPVEIVVDKVIEHVEKAGAAGATSAAQPGAASEGRD